VSFRIGRAAAALGAAGLLTGTLVGCGGGSAATAQPPGSAAALTDAAPPGGPPGGSRARQQFDPALQKKIAQCLEAAGLPVPSFRPRPSGPRPSRSFPTDRPRPSRSGGFRGPFGDPKARAALEACGIQLPTGRPPGPPRGTEAVGGGPSAGAPSS
jgi:hypothetical protein